MPEAGWRLPSDGNRIASGASAVMVGCRGGRKRAIVAKRNAQLRFFERTGRRHRGFEGSSPVQVDIQFIAAFSAGAVIFSLLLSFAHLKFRGPLGASGWLVLSKLAFLASAIGLFARPQLSFDASASIVIMGTLWGITFAYIGIGRRLGRRIGYASILLAVGFAAAAELLLVFGTYGVEPLFAGTSLLHGGLALAAAVALWPVTRPGGLWLGILVCSPFVAIGGAYLLRLIMMAVDPASPMVAGLTGVIVALFGPAALKWTYAWALVEERLLRQQLERAHALAERQNEAKSVFLRSMSHEFRTPLNAVIGLSEVMEREALGPLPAKYRENARQIKASGRHLLDLINDLLDLSVIEAGRLELNDEIVSTGEILTAVEGMLAPRAEARGAILKIEAGTDVALYADRRRLVQVALNLASNALNYGGRGVEVTLSACIAEDGTAELRVADTGPGMTREEIDTALALYGRVGSGANHTVDGTGLGLPLSRELVALHGGSLALESTPGIGTTAIARLPAERVRLNDRDAGRDMRAAE